VLLPGRECRYARLGGNGCGIAIPAARCDLRKHVCVDEAQEGAVLASVRVEVPGAPIGVIGGMGAKRAFETGIGDVSHGNACLLAHEFGANVVAVCSVVVDLDVDELAIDGFENHEDGRDAPIGALRLEGRYPGIFGAKQMAHNVEHRITPRSVVKSTEQVRFITRVADARGERETQRRVAERVSTYEKEMDVAALVAMLEQQMKEAAGQLDFEAAAALRDQIFELRAKMDGNVARRAGGLDRLRAAR